VFIAQIRGATEFGPSRDADGPQEGEEAKVKIAKERQLAKDAAKK